MSRLTGLDFMEPNEIEEYVRSLEARAKELEEAVEAGIQIHLETLDQLADAENDRDRLREAGRRYLYALSVANGTAGPDDRAAALENLRRALEGKGAEREHI